MTEIWPFWLRSEQRIKDITPAGSLPGTRSCFILPQTPKAIGTLADEVEPMLFSTDDNQGISLKDKECFKKFHISANTVEWENGADFAPEFLRSLPPEPVSDLPERTAGTSSWPKGWASESPAAVQL